MARALAMAAESYNTYYSAERAGAYPPVQHPSPRSPNFALDGSYPAPHPDPRYGPPVSPSLRSERSLKFSAPYGHNIHAARVPQLAPENAKQYPIVTTSPQPSPAVESFVSDITDDSSIVTTPFSPGFPRGSNATNLTVASPAPGEDKFVRSQIPSPRWDSLPRSPPSRSPTGPTFDRQTASYRDPAMPTTERGPGHGQAHYRHDSLASESRDEFQPLPTTRVNSHAESVVENFSRPRNFSIKQTPPESPRYRIAHQVSPDPNHLDAASTNGGINGSFPRDRGQSISSNKSSSTYASLSVRPSLEISKRDSVRGRNQGPPVSRPPMAYRAESSGPSFGRDPIPRMASMPTNELRSSYRSQMSNSTAQGTLATERSSIVTKSSSITSAYGTGDAAPDEDDDFSVEDIMGIYEKGFDDSGPEDEEGDDESRPTTGKSEMDRRATILEAMTAPPPIPRDLNAPPVTPMIDRRSAVLEAIADLPPPIAPAVAAETGVPVAGGPVLRDSADFFRRSGWPNSGSSNKTETEKMAANQEQAPAIQEDKAPGPVESEKESFEFRRPTRQQTNLTTTGDDGRDRYGFRKHSQWITREEFEGWDAGYEGYIARRRRKWQLFLKDSGLMTDNPNRFPPRSAKTKRFVRKGIPPEWRGAAWFYYAGGPAILSKHGGVYDDLVSRQARDVDVEAIERDLHRTFPDNIRFRSGQGPNTTPGNRNSQMTLTEKPDPDETPMISSLRRVLRAFSIYNPKTGYCQSLNFLAGLLLLFVESEEQAFWLLNIITRVYLPGTHEISLEGANVDLGVLMTTLKDSMPGVFAKIGGELDGSDAIRPSKTRRQKHKATESTTRLPPITLCMTSWFMSCFIGTLPIETTLRVWDVFFYEGSKMLFRTALTVFKLGESEVKAVKDPMEIFQVVQTMPRKLIDANHFMEVCFKRRTGFNNLSQDSIDQMRQDRRLLVKLEREKLARGEDIHAQPEVKRKGTLFSRKKPRRRPTEMVS